MPKTYHVKTFGCQMNYADSEKVDAVFLAAGLRKVADVALADVVVANTCSVRQKGEDRVFGYVREVKRLSERLGRPILVGITGCMVRKTGMAERYLPEGTLRTATDGKISLSGDSPSIFNWDDGLLFRSDRIDFVFRIEETAHLPKILSAITGEGVGDDEKWEGYLRLRQTRGNPASANVIIQTGCDNFCSFCIVPHTRGRETSRPVADVVDEVSRAVAEGAKEVTLLGQNVNSYGKETRARLWNPESLRWNPVSGSEKTPFRELLEAVGSVKGLSRIRFTSANPHDMTPDVLGAHFEVPAMMPYLHFALQSGSDEVLKRMNRKHTYADFLAQVTYLRSKDPFFGISTDLIVGFPGETEEDFEATLRAMQACEFDFAYVARYSPRKGTVSADRMEDDVSAETKAERWNRANAVLESTARKRADRMIGKTDEILVTGQGRKGGWVGRTRNFKEAFIETAPGVKFGDLLPVRITGANKWVLRAELL